MVSSSAGGTVAPPASTGTGYAMGGVNELTGVDTSSVATLAFSGEYVGVSAALLSHAKSYTTGAGFSSQARGHSCSGYPTDTRIDGVTFASDTGFTSSAAMTPWRSVVVSVASTTHGYIMGGGNEAGSRVAIIDGVSFESDTYVAVSAVLSLARQPGTSCQSSSRGFCLTGYATGSSYSGRLDGIIFGSTPTAFSQGDALAIRCESAAGHSASTKGYRVGGMPWSGTLTSIDTLDFSTYGVGTSSMVTQSTFGLATPVQSGSAGYTLGGHINTTLITAIARIDFSVETRSIIGATIARMQAAGAQSPSSGLVATGAGYVMGGTGSAGSANIIDKFGFDSETCEVNGVSLPGALTSSTGLSSSFNGYSVGGLKASGAPYNLVYKCSFSSGAVSGGVNNLSLSRVMSVGVSQPAVKGYVMSGSSTSNQTGDSTTDIEGYIFSTEIYLDVAAATAVAVTSGVGFSSAEKGYLAGGYYFISGTGAARSAQIDSFRYSDDAYVNVVADLPLARVGSAGVSSSTTGYVLGGQLASSGIIDNSVTALSFSVDSISNKSASISISRMGTCGSSSSIKGYVFGGQEGNGVHKYADIDGIEFSGETSINPTAALSAGRYGLAGAQSPSTAPTGWTLGRGYTLGGDNSSFVTTRYSFYSDSIQAVSGSTLTAIQRGAGCSSSTRGYKLGGAGPITADVSRIVFASEATTAGAASLLAARAWTNGVSSDAKGYQMGGYGTAHTAGIQGIMYDTEGGFTASAGLTQAREQPGTVYSSTNGYAIGGSVVGVTAVRTVDGIVFGASESQFNLGNALSVAQYGYSGVSSATKGYYLGYDTVGHALEVITFSTSVMAVSSLSAAQRYNSASVTSPNKGAFIGGWDGSKMASVQVVLYATSGSVYTGSQVLASGFSTAAGVQSQ